MSEFSILNLKRRQTAINQYDGMDTDRDRLNDGMEVQAGLHDTQNKPLHRLGPSSPGNARVINGGIEFPYDHSVVDLRVKSRNGNSVGGKPYTMPTPKKMKLTMDIGGNHDQSKFSININGVSPHKHTIDDSRINLNLTRRVKKVRL